MKAGTANSFVKKFSCMLKKKQPVFLHAPVGRRLLLMVFVFLPFFISAQNNREIDSLKNILRSTKQDTTRILTLKILSAKYDLSNPDTSVILSQQAYDLAQKIKWPKGIATSCNGLGTSYFRKGDYPLAMKYENRAMAIWDSLHDENGIGTTYADIGLVNWRQGDYPKALENYFRSVKIKRALGDSSAVAKTIGNIGIIYVTMNDFDKGLEYYKTAIRMYEQLGKKNDVARNYGNIGIVYSNLGIAALTNHDTVHADSLCRLSLYYYNRSLTAANEAGDKFIAARQYGNIAIDYWQLAKYDSALYFFNLSLDLKKETGDKTGIANTLGNIGEMFLEQKDFVKAEKYLLESLAAATEVKDAGDRQFALQELAHLYREKGDWKSAYSYYSDYISLKDSLFNVSKGKEIGRLEAKADFDQKEAVAEANHKKELAVAAEKEKQQTIISIAAGSGLLIVLVFSAFLLNRYRLIRKQKKIIEEEKQRSEELLLNILPAETAKELKESGKSDARMMDEVTVLFTDFKGFTTIAEKLSPQELVAEINLCFSAFDKIMGKYGIEKIKTIGDAYMAAGGLPTTNQTHAIDVVNAALDICRFMKSMAEEKAAQGKPFFEIRIGVHSGPVVAGIVGIKKFQYDIWGDTVNTASRMESSGEPGKVNISATTYAQVKDQFTCEHRGRIAAKNKGELDMYFVTGKIEQSAAV